MKLSRARYLKLDGVIKSDPNAKETVSKIKTVSVKEEEVNSSTNKNYCERLKNKTGKIYEMIG